MTDNVRIERILAMLLLNSLKGASQQERIVQLSIAGFSNIEIADFLQTTAAVVSQSLYAARRSKTSRARKIPRKRRAAKRVR